MNVSKVTQFELALLFRSLNIVKTKPKGTIASFFRTLIKFLQSCPKGSLSALWAKIKSPDNGAINVTSLVDIPKNDDADPITSSFSIIDQIPELHYLKDSLHPEVRHDPMLFIRAMYDTAVGDIVHSNNVDRSTLLTALLLLGMKSERISLILHSMIIFHLLKDDIDLINDPVLIEFIKETFHQPPGSETDATSKVSSPQTQRPDEYVPLTPLDDLAHIRALLLENQKEISQNQVCHVLSFGKADHGKLGLGDTQLNRLIPTILESLAGEDISKIASMSTYCMALSKSTGVVFLWGTGGTLGTIITAPRGDFLPQTIQFLPLHAKIQDISCGLGHALFLDRNGKVYSWGNGGNGRLGHGDTQDRAEACMLDSLFDEDIVRVQCGASHSLALTRQGQVYSWGKNSQGQCGLGNMEDAFKPQLVKGLQEQCIIAVTAGWEHSIALTQDGKMYSWGSGYKDTRRGIVPPVLGLGHSECRPQPELITSIEGIRIVGVASGWDHCLALDYQGKLLSWGSGQNGKLGHGNEENIAIPCYISALEDQKVESFSAGCEHSGCITKDGVMWAWGHGEGGRLGVGTNAASNIPVRVTALEDMRLRPEFLHCGDKFSILTAKSLPPKVKPGQEEIRSLMDRANVDQVHWEISQYLQRLHSSLDEKEASKEDKKDNSLWSLYDSSLWDEIKISIDKSTCEQDTTTNRHVVLALMAALSARSSNQLFRSMSTKLPLVPLVFQTTTTNLLTDDVPFVVEHAEDTYCNFSAYLEILSGPFLAYIQAMFDDGSLLRHLISPNAPERSHGPGYDKYVQDIHFSAKMLYHLLVLLSTNLQVVSDEVRRRIQLYPKVELKLLLEARYPINTDDATCVKNGLGASVTGVAKYDLSFLLRRDKSNQTSQSAHNKTGGDLSAQYTDGSNSITGISEPGSYTHSNYHDNHSQEDTANNDSQYHSKSARDTSANMSAATSIYDQQRNEDEEDDGEDDEDEYGRGRRYRERDGESELDVSQEYDVEEDNNSAFSSVQPQQRSQSLRRHAQEQLNQHQDSSSQNLRQRIRRMEQGEESVLLESMDSAMQQQPSRPLPNPRPQPPGTSSSMPNATTSTITAGINVSENNESMLSPNGPTVHQSLASTLHTNMTLSPAPSYESLDQSLQSSVENVAPAFGVQQGQGADSKTEEGEDEALELERMAIMRESSVATRAVSDSPQPMLDKGERPPQVQSHHEKPRLSSLLLEDDRNGPAEGSAADFEEFSPLVVNGKVADFDSDADDDGDSEEPNEDLMEEEDIDHTLQLQQALLLSIGPRKVAGIDSRLLGPVAGRRGANSIPTIRNTINNLASMVYMVLQQARESRFSSLSAGHSHHVSDDISTVNKENDVAELIKQAFRLWEVAQLTTATGWDALYDDVEQKSILLQIVRSPQSFLYIIPGIAKGLEASGQTKSIIQELFAHQSLDQFLSDPNMVALLDPEINSLDPSSIQDLAVKAASFIYFDDVLRMLEQFSSLLQTESDLRSMQEQVFSQTKASQTRSIPVDVELSLSLHRKVCVSFGHLVIDVLSVPMSWLRKSINHLSRKRSVAANTEEMLDVQRDKFLTILEILFDCCLLDIENTVSGGVNYLIQSFSSDEAKSVLQMSSFLEASLNLLFDKKSEKNKSSFSAWSVQEMNLSINFAGQFLQQVRKALDLLKSKTATEHVSDIITIFERIAKNLVDFLSETTVLLLAPPTFNLYEGFQSSSLLDKAVHQLFSLQDLPMDTIRSFFNPKSSNVFADGLLLFDLSDKIRQMTNDHIPSILSADAVKDETRNSNCRSIDISLTNAWLELAREECAKHFLVYMEKEIKEFSLDDTIDSPSCHFARIELLKSLMQTSISSNSTEKPLSSLLMVLSSLFRIRMLSNILKEQDAFSNPNMKWKTAAVKVKTLNCYLSCLCILLFHPLITQLIFDDLERHQHLTSSKQDRFRILPNSFLEEECQRFLLQLDRFEELFCVLNSDNSSSDGCLSSHVEWMTSFLKNEVSKADPKSGFRYIYSLLVSESKVWTRDTATCSNQCSLSTERLKLFESQFLLFLSYVRMDTTAYLDGLLWKELQRRFSFDGLRLMVWTMEICDLSPALSSSYIHNVTNGVGQKKQYLSVYHQNTLSRKELVIWTALITRFSKTIRNQPDFNNNRKSSQALHDIIRYQLSFLETCGDDVLRILSSNPQNESLEACQTYTCILVEFAIRELSQSSLSELFLDEYKQNSTVPMSSCYVVLNGIVSHEISIWDQVERFLQKYPLLLSEKSAFSSFGIPTKLLSLLDKLFSSMKTLNQEFVANLWWCHLMCGKYLVPNIMDLEQSSPVVISATSSAQPEFSISFWLQLPSRLSDIDMNDSSVHLFSRMTETGESNLYELISKDPEVVDSYTLSVHLLWNSSLSSWQIQLSIITFSYDNGLTSASSSQTVSSHQTRKRKVHRKKLLSLPLIFVGTLDNWTQFTLQVRQQNELFVKASEGVVEATSTIVKPSSTEITLWQIQKGVEASELPPVLIKETIPGGNWSLHQNMVVGKLPSLQVNNRKLPSAKTDSISSTSNVVIADVLWIPTALVSQANKNVPSKNLDERISVVEKLSSIHCPLSFAPSKVIEKLQLLSSNVVHLTKIWSCCLFCGSEDFAKATFSPTMIETQIDTLLQMLPILPATAQQAVVNFLQKCISNMSLALFPSALVERTVLTLLRLLAVTISNPINIAEYLTMSSPEDLVNMRIWRERVFLVRLNIGRQINAPGWIPTVIELDDNSLFVAITSVIAELLQNSHRLPLASIWKTLALDCSTHHPLMLVQQSLRGGYHPGLFDLAEVDLWPRAPLNIRYSRFLHDSIVFPGTAKVGVIMSSEGKEVEYIHSTSLGRFGNGLTFPENPHKHYYAQEMQHFLDPFPLTIDKDNQGLPTQHFPANITTVESIASSLRGVLESTQQAVQRNNATNSLPATSNRSSPADKGSASTTSKNIHRETPVESLPGPVDEKAKSITPQSIGNLFNIFHASTRLRATLVQLSSARDTDSPLDLSQNSIDQLLECIQLASIDPVETMIEQFEISKFRGVQNEVLRSLLREGDIFFLEKLANKLWKLFGIEDISMFSDQLQQAKSSSSCLKQKESLVQIVSLAGDIAVTGTKIRAISHFPSVKVANVSLERMTGRWFYECTILSDGLMQIGWANNLFRCDPVCGQGVGDHVQSWAYDGLRMKKWNVSCEVYGKRWHAGDVVGVLVDMDLLEMRFYLNGEDLGPAFEDFSDHNIYPSLSLNVRQSVRLNMGQYQFSYPPNMIDGKPFRPILAALEAGTSALPKTFSSAVLRVSSSKKFDATANGGTLTSAVSNSATANQSIVARLSEDEQRHLSASPAGLNDVTANAISSEVELLRQLQVSTGETNDLINPSAMAPTSTGTSSGQGRSHESSPSPDYETRYFNRRVEEDESDEEEEDEEDDDRDQSRSTRRMSRDDNENARRSRALRRADLTVNTQDDEDDDQGDEDDQEILNQHASGTFALGARWREDFESRVRREVEEQNARLTYEEEDEDDDDDDDEDDDDEGLHHQQERRLRRNDQHQDEDDRNNDEDDDEEEEEDDDEFDEVEDALGRRHRIRRARRRQQQSNNGTMQSSSRDRTSAVDEDRVYSIGEGHLTELRRQALIESLIGMGFPIDLSLRAAAQSDITTSESAAIAWIIEQMEHEHHGDRKTSEDSDDDGDDEGLGSELRRHRRELDLMMGDESASSRHDLALVSSSRSPVNAASMGHQHPSLSQEMGYLLQRAAAATNTGTVNSVSSTIATSAAASNVSNGTTISGAANSTSATSGAARTGSARGLNRSNLRGMSAVAAAASTSVHSSTNSAASAASTTLALSHDRLVNRRLIAEQMAELLEGVQSANSSNASGTNSESNLLSGLSSGMNPGSPSRDDATAVGNNGVLRSRLTPAVALGIMLGEDATQDAFLSSRLHAAAVAAAGLGNSLSGLLGGLSSVASGSGLGLSAGSSSNLSSFPLGITSAGAASHSGLSLRSPIPSSNSASYLGNLSNSKIDLVGSTQERLDAMIDAYCEPLPWNDSEFSFSPVLVGVYYRQRRQDLDKQEVLSQIAELDVFDMLPIVASCQYALCIFYARQILVHLLRAHQHSSSSLKMISSLAHNPQFKVSVAVPSLSSALTGKDITKTVPFAFCSLLAHSMRQSFRQILCSNHVPERLLPFFAFATETEEDKNRLPCISLFAGVPTRNLIQNLSFLERQLFVRSQSTLSVCESSAHDDLSSMEQFVTRIVFMACQSLNRRLGENFSKAPAVERKADTNHSVNNAKDEYFAEQLLKVLLETSLTDLEFASQSKFDSQDWITQAGVLHNEPSTYPLSSSPKSKQQSIVHQHMPQVFFAYWIVKLILAEVEKHLTTPLLALALPVLSPPSTSTAETELENNANSSKRDESVESLKANMRDSSDANGMNWLAIILAPETLSQVLKLTSSANESLRFCATDLAANMLALVNQHVTNTYFANVIDDDETEHSISDSNVSSGDNGDVSKLSKKRDPLLRRRSMSLAVAAIAAEYYVSAAKEKRMFQALGARMKIECIDKRICSRQVRAHVEFLLQWQTLRQQAHLDALTSSSALNGLITPASIFSGQQPSCFYTLRKELLNTRIPSIVGDENGKDDSKTKQERNMSVTQVSSTSITISWRLTSIIDELSAVDASKESVSSLKALEHARLTLYDYNLYLLALCQNGGHRFPVLETNTAPSGAILVKDRLDLVGSTRIDDLEPDTLYQIVLRSDRKDGKDLFGSDALTASPTNLADNGRIHLSVMIATESETTFGFQSENVSPNIVIGASNGLTLRNVANKKWSTARANVRLSAGVHRWEVHIDRCISKNIFIGVATREARLDNYVGCDPCGWAFLANKAIWHNKAKIKSYGELFRTGDTVTVTLDLNVGTLSFSINERILGVAIEGLVGPLYPAFSLYNEEDQITVAPVRSVTGQSTGNSSSSNTSSAVMQQLLRHHFHPPHLAGVSLGRSFASEMMLDRLDVLRRLMKYLYHTPSSRSTRQEIQSAKIMCAHLLQGAGRQPQYGVDSLLFRIDENDILKADSQPASNNMIDDTNNGINELTDELRQRFQLWIVHDIAVRTVNLHGTIHLLLISESLVREFSQGRFGLHHRVLLEKRYGMIVGVGSHRLWLRMDDDGELVPLTQETMLQMVDKNLFIVASVAAATLTNPVNSPNINSQYLLVHDLRPIATYQKAGDGSLLFDTDKEKEEHKVRETIVQNVLATLKALSVNELEALIIEEMNSHWTREDDDLLMKRLFSVIDITSPFAVSASQVAYCLMGYLPIEPRQKTETMLKLKILRWFVFIMYNDTLLSTTPTVLPLVSVTPNKHSMTHQNLYHEHNLSLLLVSLRKIIFPNVKDEMAMSIVHHQSRKSKETLSSMQLLLKEYDRYFQHRHARILVTVQERQSRLHIRAQTDDAAQDCSHSMDVLSASSPLPRTNIVAPTRGHHASLFSQSSPGAIFSMPPVPTGGKSPLSATAASFSSTIAGNAADSNKDDTHSSPTRFHQHLLPLFEGDKLMFHLRPSSHIKHELRQKQRHSSWDEIDSGSSQSAWQLANELQASIVGQLKQYYQRVHTIYMHTCHMSASSAAGPNPLSNTNNSASTATLSPTLGNNNGINPNGAFSGNHAHNITHSLSPFLTTPSVSSHNDNETIPNLLLFDKFAPLTAISVNDNNEKPTTSHIQANHIDTMKRLAQSVHIKGREPQHWEVLLRAQIPASQMYTLAHHHVHSLSTSTFLDVSSSNQQAIDATNVQQSLIVKQMQALIQALPFHVRISPVDISTIWIVQKRDRQGESQTRARHREHVQTCQNYQQQLLRPFHAVLYSPNKFKPAVKGTDKELVSMVKTLGEAATLSFNRFIEDSEHLLFTAMVLQKDLPTHLWSEYTSMTLMVDIALAQAQLLFNDPLLFGTDSRLLADHSVGQASLLLHHMYDIGCLLGMSLRLQLPSVHLMLPSKACYALLAGEISKLPQNDIKSKTQENADRWLESCVLSMRHGLLSMYPESVWDLWTSDDVIHWLNPLYFPSCAAHIGSLLTIEPNSCSTPPHAEPKSASLYIRVRELRRRAQYANYIAPHDRFVQCFWLALLHISTAAVVTSGGPSSGPMSWATTGLDFLLSYLGIDNKSGDDNGTKDENEIERNRSLEDLSSLRPIIIMSHYDWHQAKRRQQEQSNSDAFDNNKQMNSYSMVNGSLEDSYDGIKPEYIDEMESLLQEELNWLEKSVGYPSSGSIERDWLDDFDKIDEEERELEAYFEGKMNLSSANDDEVDDGYETADDDDRSHKKTSHTPNSNQTTPSDVHTGQKQSPQNIEENWFSNDFIFAPDEEEEEEEVNELLVGYRPGDEKRQRWLKKRRSICFVPHQRILVLPILRHSYRRMYRAVLTFLRGVIASHSSPANNLASSMLGTGSDKYLAGQTNISSINNHVFPWMGSTSPNSTVPSAFSSPKK